jgi:hypothetical protein
MPKKVGGGGILSSLLSIAGLGVKKCGRPRRPGRPKKKTKPKKK